MITLPAGVNLPSSTETHVHFIVIYFLCFYLSYFRFIHVQAPLSSLPYSIYLINSSKTFASLQFLRIFAPLTAKPPLKHSAALSPFLYKNPQRLIMNLSFAKIAFDFELLIKIVKSSNVSPLLC